MKAIKDCDLLIIDEAHRVSPNGQAYKELLDQFDEYAPEDSKLFGLLLLQKEELVIKKISWSWLLMQ